MELVSAPVPPIPLEEPEPELDPELDPEGELDPPVPLLKEITAKSIFPEEGFTMMS